MQISETNHNYLVDMNHPSHALHLFTSLQNNRYAIIRNHSINLQNLNKIYQQWEVYFGQAAHKKEKYLYFLDTDDGYVPMSAEYMKDSNKPDLKEFYQIHLDGLLNRENACSEETKKLFQELAFLGENITKIIDDNLPLQIKESMTTSLCSAVQNSKRHCMRFIHYPPCLDSEEPYRSTPHNDICLITIIVPTRGEGLMIKKKEGWTQENYLDTSLVIFNSEMLETCTQGYMKSMTHHVTTDLTENAKSISRYSMPFFVHPHSETILKKNLTSFEAVRQRIKETGLDKVTV